MICNLFFQLYLSSLKKKQKQVQKKYKGNADDQDSSAKSEEEDSDLASLQREFAKEEIQSSPFLKRNSKTAAASNNSPRQRKNSKSQSSAVATTTTPLPEQEAPFFNSLAKKTSPTKENANKGQTSAALENFMRFNKKYNDAKTAAGEKEVSETEPEISEADDVKSPSRIVSELEEKIRPRKHSIHRKDSRSALSNSKEAVQKTHSERLRQQAKDKNLRLTLQSPSVSNRRSEFDAVFSNL